LSKVGLLRRGDIIDSLRVWWKLPELSDRLTMLAIVGTRSAEHSLRSHVGIGSESHSLLGQLNKILEISDSEASLKVEKSGGVFGEEDECRDDDVEKLLVRERQSLDILSVKKEARLSSIVSVPIPWLYMTSLSINGHVLLTPYIWTFSIPFSLYFGQFCGMVICQLFRKVKNR